MMFEEVGLCVGRTDIFRDGRCGTNNDIIVTAESVSKFIEKIKNIKMKIKSLFGVVIISHWHVVRCINFLVFIIRCKEVIGAW